MAKGRSHSRSRDVDTVANQVDIFESPLRPTWVSRPLLDPIHDLRIYHPYRELLQPVESSRSTVGSWRPARVTLVQKNRSYSFRENRMGDVLSINNRQRAIPVFQKPDRVPVCVRRNQRREVLFAKGKSGRGYKKPRWKERSYMRCR